jgi:hypothetical protein
MAIGKKPEQPFVFILLRPQIVILPIIALVQADPVGIITEVHTSVLLREFEEIIIAGAGQVNPDLIPDALKGAEALQRVVSDVND